VCRPRGVHVMSHMLVLDARLCVLRENVPDHHLPGCGCVGTTRTSNPLREVYVASNLVFFCNICVEEILAGNRSLGTLNARGYINLGQFFSQTWKQYTQNQYFWKIILDQYWSREEPSYGGSHGKSRLVGGQHKG
jgi:hypothetical protein